MRAQRGIFQSTLALLVAFVTVPALAQTAPAAPPAWMQFAPFIFMMVVMYFLMIRPQAKRQKTHQEFLTKLKRGDQVLTASGIFGRVEGITDQFITLEVAEGVRVKILKTQIAGPAITGTEAKA